MRLWPQLQQIRPGVGDLHVHDLGGHDVSEAIHRIPIPHNLMRHKLSFMGRELGNYSVSKAYKLITEDQTSLRVTDWGWIW